MQLMSWIITPIIWIRRTDKIGVLGVRVWKMNFPSDRKRLINRGYCLSEIIMFRFVQNTNTHTHSNKQFFFVQLGDWLNKVFWRFNPPFKFMFSNLFLPPFFIFFDLTFRERKMQRWYLVECIKLLWMIVGN